MSGGELPLPAIVEESDGGERQQKVRIEDPSSSRRPYAEFWPELLERVAIQVALGAVIEGGRIAAAPALAAIFQVCSCWRKISLLESLWEDLTHHIWSWTPRHIRGFSSWREEFSSLHRRAKNFHDGTYTPTEISSKDINHSYRLALSNHYLVVGSARGAVHVYSLPSVDLIVTRSLPAQITGLVLMGNRLIFASEEGDICITHIDACESQTNVYTIRSGDIDEDGSLVDFISDGRWWVGLYGKLEGFSWRVWDGESEQEVYAGAFIVDNMIICPLEPDLEAGRAARICVVEEGLVVVGTRDHVWVMRVGPTIDVIEEMEIAEQSVYQMSASNGRILLVDDDEAVALIFDGKTLEEVGEFNLMERRDFHSNTGVGCMNSGFAIMWEDEIYGGVWDVEVGKYLYCLEPRPKFMRVAMANDRYVVGCSIESVHVWDFGG